MKASISWVLISLLAVTSHGDAADAPEVVIAQGVVHGLTATSQRGREFLSYRGIPYAKPPVGDLRFRAPQPLEAGNGVINGTVDGPFCAQKNLFSVPPSLGGAEDCLYINVHTPQTGSSARLPVMVWIHGGGWLAGSGASWTVGPNYLLDKDIVLVSFNYRLGALGFLSTGDAAAPGNNGMKDQVAALRWVRDNIAAFGGDPGSVTLFGQSAGSASVHLHMFSDLSTGLFHRAISQSAAALNTWAYPHPDPLSMAKQLAAFFDCPLDDTQQLVDCLRDVHPLRLADVAGSIFNFWSIEPVTKFVPVVEYAGSVDPFLTDIPLNMAREGRFNRVPWVCGAVAQEGILRGEPILSDPTLLTELNANWTTLGPRVFELWKSIDDSAVMDDMWKNVTDFYFNNELPITIDNGIDLIDLYTDRLFTHGIHKSALLQAGHGHDSIYMYSFNYKGLYTYAEYYAINDVDFGISHTDDLIYLFKPLGLFPEWPQHHPDLKVVDSMVTLWTNFAIYGTPTPPGEVTLDHVTCDINSNTTDDRCDLSQLSWSPVPTVPAPDQSQLHTSYLNIYVDDSSSIPTLDFAMEKDFLREKMAFWDNSNLKENLDSDF